MTTYTADDAPVITRASYGPQATAAMPSAHELRTVLSERRARAVSDVWCLADRTIFFEVRGEPRWLTSTSPLAEREAVAQLINLAISRERSERYAVLQTPAERADFVTAWAKDLLDAIDRALGVTGSFIAGYVQVWEVKAAGLDLPRLVEDAARCRADLTSD